jgi:hypothetical protein
MLGTRRLPDPRFGDIRYPHSDTPERPPAILLRQLPVEQSTEPPQERLGIMGDIGGFVVLEDHSAGEVGEADAEREPIDRRNEDAAPIRA